LIHSTNGKFILRTIKNREQGITEYLISQKLTSHCLCPVLKTTKFGTPYVESSGKYFNLQEYIEPQPLTYQSIKFDLLGHNISLFHKYIKNDSQIIEQNDRFNLKDTWQEVCNILSKDINDFKEIEEQVKHCLTREYTDTVYIHGDLGKWNLLLHKQQIYIIDFGEVRKGNHHFDIAAVLTSTLDLNAGETRVIKSLTDFQRGYLHNMDDFNWLELKENIRLWLIRGIVAFLKHNKVNCISIEQCRRMLEVLRKFERLLLDNFI
jgi:thiamine kinase-like enzyme